jgi:hypothetical protein
VTGNENRTDGHPPDAPVSVEEETALRKVARDHNYVNARNSLRHRQRAEKKYLQGVANTNLQPALDANFLIPRPMKHPKAPPGTPAPQMLPRPEGMSRQVHRRLFREACKIAGVDYRDAK